MTIFKVPMRSWTASPNVSSRGGQRVRLVVAHDCEGSEAGAIATFANPASRVSAHAVMSADGSHLTCMVDWANKAWACCDFNSVSDNIEMPGFAAKGYSDQEWAGMASTVAWRCKVRGLKPIWAKNPQTDEGFTSHYLLGRAGGGHTDPTTDMGKWAMFCSIVAQAYDVVDASDPPPGAPAAPLLAPPGFAPHGDERHDFAVGSIEWCQMELNALGFSGPRPLMVDGIVGTATRAATLAFQLKYALSLGHPGLVGDSVLGPMTILALKLVAGK